MSNNSCLNFDKSHDPYGRSLEVPPGWIINGARRIIEGITGFQEYSNWESLLVDAEAKLEVLKAKDRLSGTEKGDISSLEWSMAVIRRLIALSIPWFSDNGKPLFNIKQRKKTVD